MSDSSWPNNQSNKAASSQLPQNQPGLPPTGAPAGTPANPTSASQESQFRTENIGKWASQQENPFAAQNRKDAAKRRAKDEKRKKVSPYVIIGASVAAVAIALTGLIFLIINLTSNPLPEDIAMGSEGATIVNDDAQKVFDNFIKDFYANNKGDNPSNDGNGDGDGDDSDNENGDNNDSDNVSGSVENPSPEAIQGAIDAVNKYFGDRNDQTTNDAQRIDLVLVEMSFYAGNGSPESVIRAAEKITTDNMTDMQKGQYWGMLMNASYNTNDSEAGNKYLDLLSGLPE